MKKSNRSLKLLPQDTTLRIVAYKRNSTILYETNCNPSNLSTTIDSILSQYKELVHYISVRIYYKTAPEVKLNEFTCFSLDIHLTKKTLLTRVPTLSANALYATKTKVFSVDSKETLLAEIFNYVSCYAEKRN